MKWKTTTLFSLIACTLLTSPLLTHAEGSFQQTEDGIVYTSSDGTVLTGWQEIDGNTYYLNEDGTLLTGWQTIEDATYYFETDGRLITGAYTIDGTTYTEYIYAEDREVRGAVSGSTQREMGFTDFGPNNKSLTNPETHQFIDYTQGNTPRPDADNPNDGWEKGTGNQTGQVNIQEYLAWLCANGYFTENSANCTGGTP